MSKTIKILIGILAAIAVIVLAACGGGETPSDPLAGTRWQVRSYYNPAEVGGMASPLGDTPLTAEFADGAVGGSAGCNSYNGSYTLDGDSLSIGPLAATRMFCEGLMDQEAAFLAAMQSASSFKLQADQLHILNDQGQVVVDLIPPTPAPGETETPPAADDSWDRIQAAGKMVVGTAADYPPFESYVGPGQIDGFDIALMDEIGRRLGVAIEYRDLAFDGLGPALAQGQIDAAIAAISRTPEREALMGFSNVYLVSEDGVLARQDSNIVINSADDLAAYKVGVQRDTVYQDWMQRTLIDAGRMSPDNLFAYEKAEHALRDLRDGRVDLVVLDAQAAQAFVEQGGVKLVAKGRGQQSYAIALPQGAAALKAKLDETITALYNDGTIANLAQHYLDIAKILPTPTPAPTSTPAPKPPCMDGLTLVKHLTQEGEMKPGQAFTKGWQVQNTGSCAWDTGYRLVFVSGHKMGGAPLAVARQVEPGQTYDIQLNLVAPLKPGNHQGVWQMQNAKGQAFGERLKVSVKVPAAPTVTPAPTQTPAPGIAFTVDRTQIKAGECVNFSWKVDHVKAVYFYKEGERWQDHGVTGQESRRECPPSTATYYLRVVKPDNAVDVRQITIYVQAAPDAPIISRFTVDPPGQITLGQCVTIKWKVEGQIDRVKLAANGEVLWDYAPTKGNTQHCPGQNGAVAYALEAVGPGGTSRGQQTVNVVDAATATPAPTAAPEQPVIHSFSVSPNQIPAGECVGIGWSAGGGASYTRILRNGAVIVDDAGFSGQQQDCLSEAGNYSYRFEAYNPAGDVVFQEAGVNVSAAPPDNPLAGTRWQVTALSDPAVGGINVVLPGSTLTMAFGGTGAVDGSSGCNTYSASYTVQGASLAITPPSGTDMLCETPEGIMEQEAAFLALLSTVGSYSIEGDSLYLQNAAGQVMMELVSAP